MPSPAPPAAAPADTGFVLIDGGDSITGALIPLVRELGARLTWGVEAADAVDLAVRSGEAAARPDLVILTGDAPGRPARWVTWRALGIPHLPIECDADRVSVGPLVVPGTACLRCIQLHRYDARRLDAHPPTPATTIAPPDPTLTALGAGVAALVARNVLMHRRYLPGVSLELRLPDPHIGSRRWEPHPRCDGHESRATMAL